MADVVSNYLRDALNNHVHGGPAFTPPTTTYFALMTAAPTASGGGTEVSGGSYSRVGYTNNTSNWPASSGGVKQNGNTINFGTSTAAWGTIVALAEYDASTGGNLLFIYYPTTPPTIGSGQPFSVAANGLTQGWTSGCAYSIYLRDNLNNLVHGATSWTTPATTYFTLMLGMSSSSGTGGTEVSAADYGRVSVTNNSSNWPASTGQLKENAAVINFTSGALNNWGNVVGSEERDASSGGNMLLQAEFGSPVTINIGTPFQLPVDGVMDSWTA
jgi:hypothetical protein